MLISPDMVEGFHILNVFPDLLTLERFAPLILRLVLGLVLINTGYLKFKNEQNRWKFFLEGFGIKWEPAVALMGLIEIVGGIALILGFYTQVAALLFSIMFFVELFAEYKEASLVKRDIVFYILVFAIALSLLFTGAGAIALDLPL